MGIAAPHPFHPIFLDKLFFLCSIPRIELTPRVSLAASPPNRSPLTCFAESEEVAVDSTEGMRIFTRVVRAGSLSAAGRAMGLSSASVSRKISALEESSGARLLNRTSRKLSLTQVGELYYEKACQILDHIDA